MSDGQRRGRGAHSQGDSAPRRGGSSSRNRRRNDTDGGDKDIHATSHFDPSARDGGDDDFGLAAPVYDSTVPPSSSGMNNPLRKVIVTAAGRAKAAGGKKGDSDDESLNVNERAQRRPITVVKRADQPEYQHGLELQQQYQYHNKSHQQQQQQQQQSQPPQRGGAHNNSNNKNDRGSNSRGRGERLDADERDHPHDRKRHERADRDERAPRDRDRDHKRGGDRGGDRGAGGRPGVTKEMQGDTLTTNLRSHLRYPPFLSEHDAAVWLSPAFPLPAHLRPAAYTQAADVNAAAAAGKTAPAQSQAQLGWLQRQIRDVSLVPTVPPSTVAILAAKPDSRNDDKNSGKKDGSNDSKVVAVPKPAMVPSQDARSAVDVDSANTRKACMAALAPVFPLLTAHVPDLPSVNEAAKVRSICIAK